VLRPQAEILTEVAEGASALTHLGWHVPRRGKRSMRGYGCAMAIRAVAFDVNETLFSLGPVAAQLPEGGLPLVFARVLRDGFALALTGDVPAMGALFAAHASAIGGDGGSALAAFRELDPYPDVRPALERLRDAGLAVATLDRAGLADLVALRLAAQDGGRWKPAPEPYRYAAEQLGVRLPELALVAVHSWDVHGATRAGAVAGYCTRLEGGLVDGFAEPAVTGDDLVEVVEGLLALP